VKFCFAAPGQPRPIDFTAVAGSGRSFSAWQKISGPSTAEADATPASGATYPTAAPQQIGFRRLGLFSKVGNGGGLCGCRPRLFGRLFAR
jgi:hypothetical protein